MTHAAALWADAVGAADVVVAMSAGVRIQEPVAIQLTNAREALGSDMVPGLLELAT